MTIKRGGTAIRRTNISVPVRAAYDRGYVFAGATFFDYGCGFGDDIRLLEERGVKASGWDPAHAPKAKLSKANVVNLGYVTNVIEDREERAAALRKAWSLAKDVLIVSARPYRELKTLKGYKKHLDGVLTNANTFQKFYTREGLQTWIHEILATLDPDDVEYGGELFYFVHRRKK